MSFNKKISIVVLVLGLAIIGWILWDKFLNKGVVSVKGPAPFIVKIDGSNFPCASEMCEMKFAPGEYDLTIQKENYVDISQKITLHRAEKLVINAELKKRFDFAEFGLQQAKYIKLLGNDLPLEITVSDSMRQEYDKLFEMIRGIRSLKSAILQKMSGGSLAAIVYTADNDRTYFVASDQKNLVNFGKKLNGPAAIVATKLAVVFFDNKSYKNQALMIWQIEASAPSVVTYFQKPISGDLLAVSGNGKFVFVVDKVPAPAGAGVIYKIDLEKKSKENVAESGDEILNILASKDGKYVLYGDGNYYFIVDTDLRVKKQIADKKIMSRNAAWTSDDKVIFVYFEAGETNPPQNFIKIDEYDPVGGTSREIYSAPGFEKAPSKIDFAETKEYRRVMMLIENKIYNLDYLK